MIVVLHSPQIPQNTGNIVRTCSVTNSSLILVKPLGFSISNRRVKRAGLDYWDEVSITEIDDLSSFLDQQTRPFYFFSSHAKKPYHQVSYTEDTLLIFGSETKGLPPEFLEKWPDHFVTLPMQTKKRCLNLSNAVAIAIYEALRQTDFTSLYEGEKEKIQ